MPGKPSINIKSANENYPEIECQIWVVKEKTRSVRHILTFKNNPKLLTIYIVFAVVRMINYLPVKGGVSVLLSPKTIMSGETLYYKWHLGLKIGKYFQVHKHEYPSNSRLPRTKGAICLGPSGNEQGGFRFMSLNLSKKITRSSWDTILMPKTFISHVNELTYNEPNQFRFTDRSGCPIGNINIKGVDRYAADRKKSGPTRTSSRDTGNIRGRGGAIHIIYQHWPQHQPRDTYRSGTGNRGTTWISH